MNLAGATRRRVAVRGLALLVVLVLHLLMFDLLSQRVVPFDLSSPVPQRITVVYLRELEPSAPAVVAPRPPPPPPARVRARTPARAAPPASAPEPVAEAPAVPPAPQPGPAVAEAPAEAPPAAASAPSPELAQPPVPPAFEWPGSTRLSYTLVGNWRGEMHGDAQVEWIRAGERYQVHLDVRVGLPIAPLMTRRMSSDGLLTDQGLVPQRYDENTKIVFRERRALTLLFGPETVRLADGRHTRRPAGVQDSASQFVQMSWMFTLQPQLLTTGNVIELPLALPRHVSTWVYDVQESEPVATQFGAVDAVRVVPRGPLRAGDLSAEAWFAPTLRHLPVRIRIRQDDETFIDMVLSRRPEIAGP